MYGIPPIYYFIQTQQPTPKMSSSFLYLLRTSGQKFNFLINKKLNFFYNQNHRILFVGEKHKILTPPPSIEHFFLKEIMPSSLKMDIHVNVRKYYHFWIKMPNLCFIVLDIDISKIKRI